MKQIILNSRRLAGFTIIELMLTIAVAAAILIQGVPSFQGLMERNQLTSNINQFISSLSLARSEAIRRNQRVALCPSNNGSVCAGSGYENGWIIYVDRNANNSRQPVSEELIWVSEPLPANMTLRGTGRYNRAIPYLASGRSANGLSGSVRLCKDNNTDKSKKITIITSGRVRLISSGADDCAT